MAFSPLMCLSFSLCFVGCTIHCFFIAKCLLHFDSEFCSGKFRLLLTLLLLQVSLTMEICTIFTESVAAPCAPQCRGAEGLWVPRGTSPQGYPHGSLSCSESLQGWEAGSGHSPLCDCSKQQTHGRARLLPAASENSSRTAQEVIVPQCSGVCSPHTPARAVVPPALAQSWNKCCATYPVMARSVPGSRCLQPMSSHLWGGYLPVTTPLSSLRTRNRRALSQKSIRAKEKSFGLEETSSCGKGMGFIPSISAILLSLFVA